MIERLPISLRLPLPLILLCAGVLAAVVVTAIVGQRLMTNKLQTTSDQYGASLANIASRQAIDATLDRDLISLQVILSDVAENPGVLIATIHDIENRLLAQAGEINIRNLTNLNQAQSNQRNFTATITLQDSVAGYVTVTVDQTSTIVVKQQLYWLFSLSGILLLALTITAYFFGSSRNMLQPQLESIDLEPVELEPTNHERLKNTNGNNEPDSDSSNIKTSSIENPIAKGNLTNATLGEMPDGISLTNKATPSRKKDSTPKSTPNDKQQVTLVLHFHNLKLLHQQLSQARFKSLESQFNLYLRNALPLYNGEIISLNLQQAIIQFESVESLGDSVFHACCYTLLLILLNQQQKNLNVEFSGAIYQNTIDSEEFEPKTSFLETMAAEDLILTQSLVDHPDLTEKLQLGHSINDQDSVFVRVINIEEPYRQLLEKQKLQIQSSRTAGLPIYSAS